MRKPTKQEQSQGNEAAGMVALNRFLDKRKSVAVIIRRGPKGAAVSIDGGKSVHTESDLRHAVNAALANALLGGAK